MKRIYAIIGLLLLPVLLVGGATGQATPCGGFEGGSAVVEPPPDVTDLAWDLDPANSAQVESITLKFAEKLPKHTFVCVQVTDSAMGTEVTLHLEFDTGIQRTTAWRRGFVWLVDDSANQKGQ